MAVQKKSTVETHAHRDRIVGALTFLIEAVVRVLPMCIIFGAAAYGLDHIWSLAEQEERFRVQPTVALTQAPGCRPEAARAFHELGNYAAGRSVLDPTLLRELKDAYLRCPWVKRIITIERIFPGQVGVEFVARNPYAQVLKGGYYWLIDDEGVMLPVEGVREPRPGMPVVRGDIDLRPQDGAVWDDSGVLGALQALQTIRGSALVQALPVAEIVVTRAEYLDRLSRPGRSRPRLEIVTSNGMNILWGTAGEEYPGELKDAEKIALLRQLVADGAARDVPEGQSRQLDVRTRIPGFTLVLPETTASASGVPGGAGAVGAGRGAVAPGARRVAGAR